MGDNFRQSTSDERMRAWDSYSHALTTIDLGHRLNHDGFTYSSTHKHIGILDGATEDILLQVPAGSFPHLAQMGITVGGGDIDIVGYEGCTYSAAGTAIAAVNTNRSKAAEHTALMVVTADPTITDTGTEMHVGWVPPAPVGVGQAVSGTADVQAGEEWILNESTDYLWRMTNNSGATIDLSFDLVWFEIDYTEA